MPHCLDTITQNKAPSPPKPVIIGIFTPPNDQKYMPMQIVLRGHHLFVDDRAFASVHAYAETPAPRTLIGIKITYDDDMSNLISRLATFLRGSYRCTRTPSLGWVPASADKY